MKSHAPFYRRILSDAWHMSWQHKHLWVFGFFATIIGFGSVTEPLFSASERVYSLVPGLMNAAHPLQAIPGLSTFRAVVQASPYPTLAFVICLAVMALFAAVFAWMTFISVGALVGSVRKIEKGGDPLFSDEVKLGTQRFWPVLGVNVVAELFVFAAFLLTASTLRQLMEDGGLTRGIFFVGSFIVFTLLSVAASVVAVFATCEAVLKGRSIRDSISTGIDLVSRHWLASLELALALFVASLAVGLASVLAALIASVPFVFLIVVAVALKAPLASTVVVTTAVSLMIALMVLVGSFITVFQVAAWTQFWSEISGSKTTPSKLLRLVRKHIPWLG